MQDKESTFILEGIFQQGLRTLGSQEMYELVSRFLNGTYLLSITLCSSRYFLLPFQYVQLA